MRAHAPGDEGEEDGHDIEEPLGRLDLQPLGGEDLLQRDVGPKQEVEALEDPALHQVVEALGTWGGVLDEWVGGGVYA